jgi:hypothetical protein
MSDRRTLAPRVATLALLIALALAIAARTDAGLSLASPDTAAADGLVEALDAVPDGGLVLVAFDPDLGTYAEIRPTLRTFLAALLDRGLRAALVSLTPEGRALAGLELARVERSHSVASRLFTAGFLPGAEAALVGLARSLGASEPDPLAGADALAGANPALIVVVGGNDVGPRSWVEQVGPRTDVPIAAIAPAVLLPELQPYLASGQLTALVATPRDGAAYRAAIPLGAYDAVAERGGPPVIAVLIGMAAAIALLAARLIGRAGALARGPGGRGAA